MKKVFNFILLAIPIIIILIVLVLLVEHNLKVVLPEPTGKFAVGRTIYAWKDTSRIDSLAMDAGVDRELFVWIWYPAVKTNADTATEYLPSDWQKAIAKRQGMFARLFSRKLSKVQTHSYKNAKLPAVDTQYPIILMKFGIGTLCSDYTTFAENLASNGYIVIGTDSPYSSSVVVFPGGRVISDNAKGNPLNVASQVDRNRRLDRLVTIWADDTRFTLDRLEQLNNDSSSRFYKRMNLNEVGALGPALGGAAVFRFCFEDKRCKAGVSIDGAPFGNVNENRLSKPFMFLMADNSGENDSTNRLVKTNIDTVYNELPKSRVWINIKGAKQYNLNDQALLREQYIARKNGDLGSIDKKRGLEIVSACLLTFFDATLKRQSATQIKELQNKYPEIRFSRK